MFTFRALCVHHGHHNQPIAQEIGLIRLKTGQACAPLTIYSRPEISLLLAELWHSQYFTFLKF